VLLQGRYLGIVHDEQIRLLAPARVFALSQLSTFYNVDSSQWHDLAHIATHGCPPGIDGALWRLQNENLVESTRDDDFGRKWRLTAAGEKHWKNEIQPKLPS
jgi:hypothetical protein